MSKLEDIDETKPLEFYGSRTTKSDEAFLVEMAKETGNENFLYVSSPVTDSVQLSVAESGRLLDYLKSSTARRAFDENLQCLFETQEGWPMLTGWMSPEAFSAVVAECSHPGCPVADVSATLEKMLDGWKNLIVQEVTFNGFRKAAGSEALAKH